MRIVPFRVGLLLCLGFLIQATQAQIQKIGEIQHTTAEEASKGIPVAIEGQVTHFHPKLDGMFISDGERGIYVHLPRAAESYQELKPGSIVAVKGVTAEGGFVPDVVAEEIRIVEWRPLPEPRQFHFFEIYSPSVELDCAWLTVWGRLVDFKVLQDFDYLMLELEVHGLRMSMQVPYSKETLAGVQEHMFQRIMVPAVVSTIYNRHRQMTGRSFLVNSVDDFTIIRDHESSQEDDVRAIETLMQGGADHLNEIHIRGLVTYADEEAVYLRGAATSLKASILGEDRLLPGDYVDLKGYIDPRSISPAFRAREVTVLDKREAPSAREVDLKGELDPDWNYELIQTEVTLVDIGETFGLSRFSSLEGGQQIDGGRASLLCRSGERVFEARLPFGMELDQEVKPGARLRLAGICNLVPNIDPRWNHFAEGVWLELRLNDGVSVLKPAPWWTAARLLGAVVITLGVAGLFMVWVVALRKTVARQTEVIGRQVERDSVHHERQRIARELHDTLEQSLAGTTFQLENCAKQLRSDPEKGQVSLELAQRMLNHCRKESRSSIIELRGGLLETMDLAAALGEELKPLVEECGAEFEILVHGPSRRLKRKAEMHLFRMAKEAVLNAVRHTKPKRVSLDLEFEPSSLSLTISDDGSGFDVDRLSGSERFGIQGMRERANRIHGQFEITSVIGQGTIVRIGLPSTKDWETE